MEQQPPADTPPTPDPGPDPDPGAGWSPPGVVAAPVAPLARPVAVTAAAILIMIIGVLIALFGLLFVLVGTWLSGGGDTGLSGQFVTIPAAMGGFIAVVGIMVVVFGVLAVVSGIFVLAGRGWARITAVILSVLGGLVSLGGVIGGSGPRQGVLAPLIFLVAYVFIIWAVSVNGRWFASR